MTTPNYAPTVNPGDVRNRIWRVQAENPNDLALPEDARASLVKAMTFLEEQVIRRADGLESRLERTRECTLTYTDPNEAVPLKSPLDDSGVTLPVFGGTIPMSLALTVVYSLGRLAQAKKDIAEAAQGG